MEIPKPIQERRRSLRIDESIPFRIGTKDFDIEAETVNISVGGALCILDKPLAAMTRMDIALALPAYKANSFRRKTIYLKGVVVRSEKDAVSGKYYTAIFFSEGQPSDLKSLSDFIQSRISASSNDIQP